MTSRPRASPKPVTPCGSINPGRTARCIESGETRPFIGAYPPLGGQGWPLGPLSRSSPTISDLEFDTVSKQQGQRISILLNCQDFREEVRVHHTANHLSTKAVFDGMSFEKAHCEALNQLRLLPSVRSRVRLSSSRKFTSNTQCIDSMAQWPRTASLNRLLLR